MFNILNLFLIKAYAQRTSAADPLVKFKFRMSIPGIPTTVGFQKVSGLNEEIAVTEYNEGGSDTTVKLPGRVKVGEVVCDRGMYADFDLRDLVKKTLTDPAFRGTVIIEHLDRYGATAKTYKLAEAWASKWEGTDYDATSDDVAIEKLTLQFEYFLD